MQRCRSRGRAVMGLATLLAGAGCWASAPAPDYATIALLSEGVVVDLAGMPQPVPVNGVALDDPAQRSRQDRWLAQGSVPGPPRYADLAEQALRDLEALLLPGGIPVAGAGGDWRYVWPRDASFTVAAFARTGHVADAYLVLLHLQSLQALRSTGGVFEARYLPDASGAVPDARQAQLDGDGWVLWAVAEWYAAAPAVDRGEQLEKLRPLVSRCVFAIGDNVDPLTGLPFVYPDYWEVEESSPTVGTLAALLLGLRAAAPVLEALGEPPVGDLVRLLERGLADHFAPSFTRYPGGEERDAAIAFLMPPFAAPDDDVRAAWEATAASLVRPAGGLAPGEGWKRDGVSWTPMTALFALTAAASGEVDAAVDWLDWLDQHRTSRGSLPEKVLWDGSPSAVAPLGWTCALVLLALDELDHHSSA